MRILRGLRSRLLPCGCVVGIYETYENEIIAIVDARGATCGEDGHEAGRQVPLTPGMAQET
jgi:hypothetical protein